MFFEIENVKRRHATYYDNYNIHGWVDTPDSSVTYNYLRSATSGVIGATISEMIYLFRMNYDVLRQTYEPPSKLSHFSTYFKEVRNMNNFKFGIKNRMQYAFLFGGVDVASRLTVWRYLNEGLPNTVGSVNAEFWRKFLPGFLGAVLTSWVHAPIEAAKNAYYGDRTFPKELRKNYTSIFNTLLRIPREEGLYYLFKGSLPYMFESFFQTFILFTGYVTLIDFMSPLYEYSSFNYNFIKAGVITFTSYLACLLGYPLGNMTRQMVELWPKIDGKHHYDYNYRKAAISVWYQPLMLQSYVGVFHNSIYRNFPWMFTSLWVADNIGLFKFWKTNYITNPGNNTDPTMFV